MSDTIVPFDLSGHLSDKLLQEGIRRGAYVTTHFQQLSFGCPVEQEELASDTKLQYTSSGFEALLRNIVL